jgi:hypothetical protein
MNAGTPAIEAACGRIDALSSVNPAGFARVRAASGPVLPCFLSISFVFIVNSLPHSTTLFSSTTSIPEGEGD